MNENEPLDPEFNEGAPPSLPQEHFDLGAAAEAIPSNTADLKECISSGIQEAIDQTGIESATFESHKENIIGRVISAVFELPGILDGAASREKVRVVAAQAALKYIADIISES